MIKAGIYIPTLNDCKKCTDEEIKKHLEKFHLRELAFGISPKIKPVDLPELEMELSSLHSRFFGNMFHPQIKWTTWGRGYAISVNSGKIVILRGWLAPDTMPTPAVYVYGNVPIETVRQVVIKFYQKVMYLTGRGFVTIHTGV